MHKLHGQIIYQNLKSKNFGLLKVIFFHKIKVKSLNSSLSNDLFFGQAKLCFTKQSSKRDNINLIYQKLLFFKIFF